ncbi:GGDEF domain-containing protein [Devosia sp. SL43]|uniref:GGDEF domain-containing protein n=1 Tax=Devosia sp. SL43 TaxID=2806348 RepID=UPI001F370DC9|nr:GGDEF domain-containing protein [Devosia sp. SL43]UJW86911.1 GGDEF domain-containing protein [Devosia sp. SL43]
MPEYEDFLEAMGDMLELPSERALVLRQQLGKAIHDRTSQFPKGQVQQKKTIFIQTAMAVSGVPWTSHYPFKIISSLKSNGAGDEEAALALMYLCCKTQEFEGIRTLVTSYLGEDSINNILDKASLPSIDFYLADILSREIVRGPGAEKKPAREAESDDAQDQNIDVDLWAKDHKDKLGDKNFGRNFLEQRLYEFVQEVSHERKSTVSIIDVDDMSQINKVYGRELGDFVLEYLVNIISDETKYFDCRIGRCGDDTFYVALRGMGIEKAIDIAKGIRQRVKDHPWSVVAEGLRVSVSIGVAREMSRETSAAFSVRAAVGMKLAKERGGDIVMQGPDYVAQGASLDIGSTERYWS